MAQAAALFQQTSRFREAIELINGIDAQKLTLLLQRILASLSGKVQGSGFSEKEENQLRALLGLSKDGLGTVFESSSYIFEQAAYHNLSGEKLRVQLITANVAEAQAASFSAVWIDQKESFLNKLRQATLGGPQVLESSSWRVHLSMGQQSMSKVKDLSAVVNFNLNIVDKSNPESVAVELSQAGLQSFFDSVERIQEQLDQLTKS